MYGQIARLAVVDPARTPPSNPPERLPLVPCGLIRDARHGH
jgi:hypothetical protein